MTLLAADESGMSTVEYAIGTIAAAAFGAILYTVVTGDSIVSALNQHHRSRAQYQGLAADVSGSAGASTVEAALGIAALVVVLVLCLAGVTAVSMQVRCVDAAREAARLAARGDERSAVEAARRIAPGGALVQVHRDGDFLRRDRRRALKAVAHIGYCGQSGVGGRAAAMIAARRRSWRSRWSRCCCASRAPVLISAR